MQNWRFFLRDPLLEVSFTEVEEPEGWDALEQILQRSDLYTGMENKYSENLIFTEEGADYMIAKFDLYRFDGQIEFKAELYCDAVLSFTLSGIINMVTYRNEQGRVNINFEDTSFQRKLFNRLTIPVKLSDHLSIEGVEIGYMDKVVIPFHSKAIQYTANYLANQALMPLHFTDRPNAHTTPWELSGGDVIGATEPTTTEPSGAGRSIVVNEGTIEQYIDIECRVIVSPLASITRDDAITYTYTGGFDYIVRDSDGDHTVHSEAGIIQAFANTYDFTFTITIRLDPGDSCTITFFDFYEETLPGTGTLARDQTYNYAEDSFITMLEESIYPVSTVKGYKIYEALNKVTESITDRPDAIRSDYFGRIDSDPEAYDTTGCGGEMLYTNGLAIRNMLDNNGDEFEITASFDQLFNALNVLHGIGMRVEKDAGVPYLRIEPKEYFYQNTPIKTFSNVSELIISVATEYAWNEVEIGFTKWEAEGINGIDEFNTKHNYAFPVKNINKKLTLTTDVITGGYAIETTRRQQYNSSPTTDWKYDNDGFFVSLNRTNQTFISEEENPYHLEGDVYPKTYATGTITERNEAFVSVSNVLSPETSYNLRYSPSRCMVNNYRYVAGTIAHSSDLPLKFQQGLGNTVMRTELGDSCDNIDGLISENQDIIKDNLVTNDKFPYFEPVKLEFSYPMDRVEFEFLKDNENKSILVSCGENGNYQATLKEMKYIENTQGGIVNIVALNSPCISGAYDSAYDDSFDTGSC